MTKIEFRNYMDEQISRIQEFKKRLENDENREFSLEEAAKRWVKEYAEEFRHRFETSTD